MTAIVDEVLAPRAPWSHVLRAGQTLRIIDLAGNQAVDFLAYVAGDPQERYDAQATVAAQRALYLRTGSVLRTNEGRPLLSVVSSTCEYHDTIGGACSPESNTLRYGHHTRQQHACVDNFLAALASWGLGKRDVVSNVNWFMNVPVEPDGTLGIVDGISAAGLFVELRAEVDTLVAVSNCPQVNNPCNGFDPTPVRLVVAS